MATNEQTSGFMLLPTEIRHMIIFAAIGPTIIPFLPKKTFHDWRYTRMWSNQLQRATLQGERLYDEVSFEALSQPISQRNRLLLVSREMCADTHKVIELRCTWLFVSLLAVRRLFTSPYYTRAWMPTVRRICIWFREEDSERFWCLDSQASDDMLHRSRAAWGLSPRARVALTNTPLISVELAFPRNIDRAGNLWDRGSAENNRLMSRIADGLVMPLQLPYKPRVPETVVRISVTDVQSDRGFARLLATAISLPTGSDGETRLLGVFHNRLTVQPRMPMVETESYEEWIVRQEAPRDEGFVAAASHKLGERADGRARAAARLEGRYEL